MEKDETSTVQDHRDEDYAGCVQAGGIPPNFLQYYV